jgi:hypothetical protein
LQEIRKYEVGMTFNGITRNPGSMKICTIAEGVNCEGLLFFSGTKDVLDITLNRRARYDNAE